MPAPIIAALPTAPSRNQAPDAFTTTADAFVGALPPFQAQINALVAYLNSTAMVLGQFQDGTPAAPSIRFESDPDTGFYRVGANQMGLAQGGVGLGQLFARGNILGTVSQSGGVPTGAIVERGSNANGEYVRFADGTQICYRYVQVDAMAITTALGPMFSSAAVSYALPATFISGDTGYSAAAVIGSGNTIIRNSYICSRIRTGSSTVTVADWSNVTHICASSVTAAAGEITGVRLFASGRWY